MLDRNSKVEAKMNSLAGFASNRFAELLKDIEVQGDLNFSCNGYFEQVLWKRADLLKARLAASSRGMVTRVDVDMLALLRLCVNGLASEGAEELALTYAAFAREWSENADFTDSVARGSALISTAEMFWRLTQYAEAAKLFKSAGAAFESVLDHSHPLAVVSRRRHQMALTSLAYDRRGRPNAGSGGYLKGKEPPLLAPLVWESAR
ncbi:MAG: hypothetical protein C0507_02800 [Cyanobacteria bacterium PR.3.49]|nr:hypothetical protein [Cyanobacteria bacterium PR.3.49]